jgi:uncharacterized protein (DUF2336 family)
MSDASLISEFDQAVRRGASSRRTAIAERVTDLFIDVAERVDERQIDLFDEILSRLIEEIELTARAAISRRIAPVGNAPKGVIRRLAGDGDIAVAGPVLRASPRLADDDLAVIAGRMGKPHLLAISQRPSIAAPITDVLVQRGDGSVLRAVAANHGAQFSDPGYGSLVKRAAGDDRLAETIGQRPDLPPPHLRRLVAEASEIVRRRLLATAASEARHEVERCVVAAAAQAVGRIAASFHDAQRTVLALARSGKLDENALLEFATDGRRREVVASLSAMSRVPIDVIERLVQRGRRDALLVLGRAVGIGWPTVQAIIAMRDGHHGGQGDGQSELDPADAEATRICFERMSRPSAERIVQLWRNGGIRGGAVG